MLPELELIREGSTDLFVPKESLSGREPKTFPAFFNPAARVNRDVSVAIARATEPRSFLDALAGTGARGVRVANEATSEVEVTLVEFNEVSAKIAAKNVKVNRLAGRCAMVHEESSAYLSSRFGRAERFDAVDIDPFGTPAPYVQGALTAAQDQGIVSMTATDTATLCGVYPRVALRRYGALVSRSEFSHEAAVRVLLGFCARMGGVLDIGLQPMAAHSTLHYLRVYFRCSRGAAASDSCIRQLGYVVTCASCHENALSPSPVALCQRCGSKARSIGPQWLGELVDEAAVGESLRYCSSQGWREAARAMEALKSCDRFPPFGFSLERITSREKVSSVKFQSVVEELEGSGRSAMRQPFGSSGLKTDASYEELLVAVRKASR